MSSMCFKDYGLIFGRINMIFYWESIYDVRVEEMKMLNCNNYYKMVLCYSCKRELTVKRQNFLLYQ